MSILYRCRRDVETRGRAGSVAVGSKHHINSSADGMVSDDSDYDSDEPPIKPLQPTAPQQAPPQQMLKPPGAGVIARKSVGVPAKQVHRRTASEAVLSVPPIHNNAGAAPAAVVS